MGKKRMAIIGGAEEEQLKAKAATKRAQKKLREGKTAKAPGLAGGQRVVDTTAESLRELEVIEAKKQEVVEEKKPQVRPVKIRSKAYQAAKSQVNPAQKYALDDAIKLLRNISYSKANTTVELHITLKGGSWAQAVDLPYSPGKTRRVAVANAETLAGIAKGKTNFDVLLARPADMPGLVKFAKVLGPKGLMPNPKTGTVVDDPESVAKKLSSSNTSSLRTEKDTPVVHTIAGKLSLTDDQLSKNIAAILQALPENKVAKVILKSTMSPAIKLAI